MDIEAGCLYTLVHADRSRHEEILDELVAPVTREVRDDPQLDSLFFARYNEHAPCIVLTPYVSK